MPARTEVSWLNCWRIPPALSALEPEQTAPRSATTTRAPAPASSHATVHPAMPAPITSTSHVVTPMTQA
jgi:hypothetical protein